jgi:hypothetical protein
MSSIASPVRPVQLTYIQEFESPVGTLGAMDGVNTTFTLAHTPQTPVDVFLNGWKLRLNRDYTLSGQTLTLATAEEFALLEVDYWHA